MQNSKSVVYGVLAGFAMILAWMLLNDILDATRILTHQ